MDHLLLTRSRGLRHAHPLHAPTVRRQQGATVYVILIMVLLSAILGLWASRTALFSELITGNDADYQRAFEAAQAAIQDAKDDIYLNLYAPGKAATRSGNAHIQYPAEPAGFMTWAASLTALPTGCQDGVCLRRTGAENFWEDETALASMLAVGARYGQFSGNPPGTHSNPILSFTAANKGAWYWVEPIPYKGAELGNTSALVQGTAPAVVEADMLFRITALALGLKESSSNDTDVGKRSKTMAVIQTTVALPVNKGE